MDPTDGPVVLPRTGDAIDRHVVVGEIARGGMAAVFAVRRSGVGGFEKLLALKMILPHLAIEQHFVQMFLDEARLASQIDHPNVCRVLDVGTHREVPYLLMELVHGRSFAAIDARARDAEVEPPCTEEPSRCAARSAGIPRPGAQASAFGARNGHAWFWLGALAQAAEGLHGAHEARGTDGEPLGIVHRDVSPQNFLMGFDGRVRVVDFGIAAGRGRLVGTRTGEIKGKLAYLSPEQIQRDQAISRATDLWGLGVVAWELFAGRRLFADAEEAKVLWSVMSARVPDLAKEAPHLPREAAATVMQCLERDATQRPVDARAVAKAFAAAAAAIERDATAPLPAAESMLARLFPDARPQWSEPLPGPSASPHGAPAELPAAAKPGVDTGETATVALPIAPAAPPSRTVRWLVPAAALVAAALIGAALSRSSTRQEAGSAPDPASAPTKVDGVDETSAAPPAAVLPASAVVVARPASAPTAPASAAARPPAVKAALPASHGGKAAGPRPTGAAPPAPSSRPSGPLMSNPF